MHAAQHGIAAQLRADAGEHLHGIERLCDIIIRADGKAEHLIGVLAFCSKQDYGNIAFFAQRRRSGKAVRPGHHHVQQHKMDCFARNDAKRIVPVIGFKRVIPFCSEIDFQRCDDITIVITNEDIIHACSPPLIYMLIVAWPALKA